jgi:hypothetical protein
MEYFRIFPQEEWDDYNGGAKGKVKEVGKRVNSPTVIVCAPSASSK